MLCVLTVLEKKGETKLYHTYGSTYVRKLQTETAHLTLPITYFSLRAKCWLRGGVGGQFYRYVLWSILIYSVRIKRKVTPWTFIWKGDKQTIKLLRVCPHFLKKKYKSLFEFWCAEFTCDYGDHSTSEVVSNKFDLFHVANVSAQVRVGITANAYTKTNQWKFHCSSKQMPMLTLSISL